MATDKDLARMAAEEADKGRPDPSIVDLAPSGSLVVPAAAMRLLERVQAVEPDLDSAEANFFVLYITAEAQRGKKARAALWKLGRNPKALYEAFQEWLWSMPADKLTELMNQITPELEEYERNSGMVAGDDDDDTPGGSEGNASG